MMESDIEQELTQLRTTAAGLRRALEGLLAAIPEETECEQCGEMTAVCANDTVWAECRTALAASPDEHARRTKAEALEALRWWFDEDHEPEREAVRIKREEAGTRWTSDQWIAAVLDAMEQEEKG